MNWKEAAAILALAALCGLWVLLQRWLARVDPGLRGVEDGCGTCHDATCERRGEAAGTGSGSSSASAHSA